MEALGIVMMRISKTTVAVVNIVAMKRQKGVQSDSFTPDCTIVLMSRNQASQSNSEMTTSKRPARPSSISTFWSVASPWMLSPKNSANL